jgi:hypothetical protein
MYPILIRKCCYLYKYGTAREIVCACYGGLTVGLDSRHPASCRGNSGEAGDAKPENLDSGPKVSFNLLFTTYFFFLRASRNWRVGTAHGSGAPHWSLKSHSKLRTNRRSHENTIFDQKNKFKFQNSAHGGLLETRLRRACTKMWFLWRNPHVARARPPGEFELAPN